MGGGGGGVAYSLIRNEFCDVWIYSNAFVSCRMLTVVGFLMYEVCVFGHTAGVGDWLLLQRESVWREWLGFAGLACVGADELRSRAVLQGTRLQPALLCTSLIRGPTFLQLRLTGGWPPHVTETRVCEYPSPSLPTLPHLSQVFCKPLCMYTHREIAPSPSPS